MVRIEKKEIKSKENKFVVNEINMQTYCKVSINKMNSDDALLDEVKTRLDMFSH